MGEQLAVLEEALDRRPVGEILPAAASSTSAIPWRRARRSISSSRTLERRQEAPQGREAVVGERRRQLAETVEARAGEQGRRPRHAQVGGRGSAAVGPDQRPQILEDLAEDEALAGEEVDLAHAEPAAAFGQGVHERRAHRPEQQIGPLGQLAGQRRGPTGGDRQALGVAESARRRRASPRSRTTKEWSSAAAAFSPSASGQSPRCSTCAGATSCSRQSSGKRRPVFLSTPRSAEQKPPAKDRRDRGGRAGPVERLAGQVHVGAENQAQAIGLPGMQPAGQGCCWGRRSAARGPARTPPARRPAPAAKRSTGEPGQPARQHLAQGRREVAAGRRVPGAQLGEHRGARGRRLHHRNAQACSRRSSSRPVAATSSSGATLRSSKGVENVDRKQPHPGGDSASPAGPPASPMEPKRRGAASQSPSETCAGFAWRAAFPGMRLFHQN